MNNEEEIRRAVQFQAGQDLTYGEQVKSAAAKGSIAGLEILIQMAVERWAPKALDLTESLVRKIMSWIKLDWGK